MKKFDELNHSNATVIEWDGKTLKTTQDPYISDDGEVYTAHAVDAEDNEYILAWEVIDPEITDESSICDWDNPVGVTLVK